MDANRRMGKRDIATKEAAVESNSELRNKITNKQIG
jgi:hypothetical protein